MIVIDIDNNPKTTGGNLGSPCFFHTEGISVRQNGKCVSKFSVPEEDWQVLKNCPMSCQLAIDSLDDEGLQILNDSCQVFCDQSKEDQGYVTSCINTRDDDYCYDNRSNCESTESFVEVCAKECALSEPLKYTDYLGTLTACGGVTTQSPTTQPPTTQPPATQPPATQPSSTQTNTTVPIYSTDNDGGEISDSSPEVYDEDTNKAVATSSAVVGTVAVLILIGFI